MTRYFALTSLGGIAVVTVGLIWLSSTRSNAALAERFSRQGEALCDRRRFALMYIDLDGFKRVNDSLGHPAGDHLLRVAAARIRKTLCRTDLLFRMGRDEFTVILTELASDDDAGGMAQRIIQAVSASVTFGDRSVGVGASVGIAI